MKAKEQINNQIQEITVDKSAKQDRFVVEHLVTKEPACITDTLHKLRYFSHDHIVYLLNDLADEAERLKGALQVIAAIPLHSSGLNVQTIALKALEGWEYTMERVPKENQP